MARLHASRYESMVSLLLDEGVPAKVLNVWDLGRKRQDPWRSGRGWSTLWRVWSAYAGDDPSRQANDVSDSATPGLAPDEPPGLNPIELVVDGETFVVTQRPGSPRTFDFAWTSHPQSYGFAVGTNADWTPDRAELVEEIRSFLAQIDPETGFLPD